MDKYKYIILVLLMIGLAGVSPLQAAQVTWEQIYQGTKYEPCSKSSISTILAHLHVTGQDHCEVAEVSVHLREKGLIDEDEGASQPAFWDGGTVMLAIGDSWYNPVTDSWSSFAGEYFLLSTNFGQTWIRVPGVPLEPGQIFILAVDDHGNPLYEEYSLVGEIAQLTGDADYSIRYIEEYYGWTGKNWQQFDRNN